MAVDTIQLHSGYDLKRDLVIHERPVENWYEKWRPRFHVMPARGWMNDPCAPGYDEKNGRYTLSFQWNPKGVVWGNMSWGSAVSTDMVTWTISNSTSMHPDSHDPCGVFTGSLLPGSTEAFYTSAQRLPIGYTLPYYRGSEKLHHATTNDSGRTWKKTSKPVLEAPPHGLEVTGFRDPAVTTWPALDRIRNDQALYGMLSGGIRSKTPTIFLYRVNPDVPRKWEYLSQLANLGLRYQPSRWTGNYGVNWEVASLVTLQDQRHQSRDVILVGSQGIVSDEDADHMPLSTNNQSMWMCGDLESDLSMKWRCGGTLDHGCCYAASGFHDPLSKQFVFFGWIFEEDLPPELTEQQKWSGCLSIPRVLSTKLYEDVTALRTDATDITCFETEPSTRNGHNVQVLQIAPDPRLQQLRRKQLPPVFGKPYSQLEVKVALDVVQGETVIGFELQHSTLEKTVVSFCLQSETIIVDRSQSSSFASVTKSAKTAPHTLFRSESGTLEKLHFHIYFDTSVLEIFVNERTALTTRVYPSTGSCTSIRPLSPRNVEGFSCEAWSLAGTTIWQ